MSEEVGCGGRLVAVAEIAPVLLTHGPQYYIDKWTRALYVAALI